MNYTVAPDGKSITCGHCGYTSHNVNDIANKYCGNCHRFHEDRFGDPTVQVRRGTYATLKEVGMKALRAALRRRGE